jgi:hypothetical protein
LFVGIIVEQKRQKLYTIGNACGTGSVRTLFRRWYTRRVLESVGLKNCRNLVEELLMMHEKEILESRGYVFEIDEEPVTEPDSEAVSYFVVTILRNGEILGTRSEMTQERALERAVEFAQKHTQGGTPRGLMPKGWEERPARS